MALTCRSLRCRVPGDQRSSKRRTSASVLSVSTSTCSPERDALRRKRHFASRQRATEGASRVVDRIPDNDDRVVKLYQLTGFMDPVEPADRWPEIHLQSLCH